jgi:hypothetical protein
MSLIYCYWIDIMHDIDHNVCHYTLHYIIYEHHVFYMIFGIMIILFKLVCPWQRMGTFLVYLHLNKKIKE